MEWDSKVNCWGFSEELGRNMGIVGTSDCSVDLKLGGIGDIGLGDKWNMSSSSSPSQSKRARQPGNASQVALCSVDGCRADLSNCRDYHRRHKVCEAHSKIPVVMVNGQQQRFCQQCSRFHSLVEFDEVKRSCRKRLDGHNRRRRKPQPESMNPAVVYPNTQGTSFLSFNRMMPASLPEPNWGGIIKTGEDSTYTPQLPLHSSAPQPHFTGLFSHERQLPFLQEGQIDFTRTGVLPTTSTCQPLLDTIPSTQVPDSDCALSLLSSQTHSSGISMGCIMPAERIPMGQPLVSAIEYSSLGQFSSSQVPGKVPSIGFGFSRFGEEEEEEELGGRALVTASEANVHCHNVFDLGSSDSGSQSLPFSWQ